MERTKTMSERICSYHSWNYLYEVHPSGKHFIAYQFSYDNNKRQVIAVVDRFIADDKWSAMRWCSAQYDLEVEPWDRSAEANEIRESARVALQELHELEKQQDRYRIYN